MNRQLRRAQAAAKNAHSNGVSGPLMGQLQSAIGDLKKVQELGETAEIVAELSSKLQAAEALITELAEMKDDLKTTLERVSLFDAELARQRAVFLRFLFSPDILVSQGPEMAQK